MKLTATLNKVWLPLPLKGVRACLNLLLFVVVSAALFSCNSSKSAYTGQPQWGTFHLQASQAQATTQPFARRSAEEHPLHKAEELAYTGNDLHTTTSSLPFTPEVKAAPKSMPFLAAYPVLQLEKIPEAVPVFDKRKPARKTERHSAKAGKSKIADDGRKVPGVAIAGFVLTVFAVASVFLGFVWFPIFLMGIMAGFMGFFMSKGALNTISDQPDLYKGKGWARVGLILGILYLAFIGLLLLSLSGARAH